MSASHCTWLLAEWCHPSAALPPRAPAPSDGGATPPGQTLRGGESQMAYLLFDSLVELQRSSKTWGEAARFTWNLLRMTKDSFGYMLATFQGLPRWF